MPNRDLRKLKWRILIAALNSRVGLRYLNRLEGKSIGTPLPGHACSTVHIPRNDGTGLIRTRIYRPEGQSDELPVLLFFHGGGYAIGRPERAHDRMRVLQETRPCIIIAPDYRLTLEAPYPAGHDDCYDALLWVYQKASEIGGRADQIIVFGDSAGGGLTLSTCLRARDEGQVPIAAQIPLYPMIDDRPENWTDVGPGRALWTQKANALGWSLLLDGIQTPPAYATPARTENLANLPPTLSFCGDQDVFLNENRVFFERMKTAGCDVTFREFEDTWHALEALDPGHPTSRKINAWFLNQYAQLVDRVTAG